MDIQHNILRLIIAYPVALRGISQVHASGDCTLALGNKGIHFIRRRGDVLHLLGAEPGQQRSYGCVCDIAAIAVRAFALGAPRVRCEESLPER